jgi:solute carrier family 25 phosphate transporter 23/24/25/41
LNLYQIQLINDQIIPFGGSVSKISNQTDLKHLIAGGAAASIAKTCVAPIERVRLLYQLEGNFSKIFVPQTGSNYAIHGFKTIISLFKGNGVAVMKIIPSSSLYFYAFNKSKVYLKAETDLTDMPRVAVASMIGSLVSTSVSYPMDTIYTRVSGGKFTLKNAIIEGKLYKGSGLAISYYMPYSCCCIGFYEWFKEKKFIENKQLNSLSAGAIGGVIAHTIIYPFETIKRTIQNDSMNNGLWKIFRSIPIKSLWAGLPLVFVRTPIHNGILMMLYETFSNGNL